MDTLEWVWTRLDVITRVLAVPWGLFAISLVLAGWRKVTETSGSDIYVILASLDLEFILFKDQFSGLVYAGIQSKFTEVFGIGLIVSLIFLAISSGAQRRIAEHNAGMPTSHPTGTLFLCWVFALSWMAIHFFAILAR
jgi:uncharacterized membrane protein